MKLALFFRPHLAPVGWQREECDGQRLDCVSVGPSERLDDFDAVKRLVHELAEIGEER